MGGGQSIGTRLAWVSGLRLVPLLASGLCHFLLGLSGESFQLTARLAQRVGIVAKNTFGSPLHTSSKFIERRTRLLTGVTGLWIEAALEHLGAHVELLLGLALLRLSKRVVEVTRQDRLARFSLFADSLHLLQQVSQAVFLLRELLAKLVPRAGVAESLAFGLSEVLHLLRDLFLLLC